MINLEKAIFVGMNEELKKEVKKDISKFKLFLGDFNSEVRVTKPYGDTNLIVLDCKGITHFDFPKSSKNNKFEKAGETKERYAEINMSFDYHNHFYRIYGII
jgi:hypothetical protein